MTTAEDYIGRVLHHMPPATPLRAQIALELRGHIAERVAHGQPVDDVVAQLGDPLKLAESYLSAVALVPAPFWRRAVAKLLDAVIVFGGAALLFAPIAWVLWKSENQAFLIWVPILAIVTANVLFLVYTVIAEWQWSQTIGKRMLNLAAVRESGARIGGGQAIVRHAAVFFQVFLLDVMFALFTERHQRAFELLSKTRVVMASNAVSAIAQR